MEDNLNLVTITSLENLLNLYLNSTDSTNLVERLCTHNINIIKRWSVMNGVSFRYMKQYLKLNLKETVKVYDLNTKLLLSLKDKIFTLP